MAPQRVLGIVFVALGAMLVIVLTTDIGAESIVAVVGGGFLAAYLATRAYGLLIPGGILTGLGIGIILASAGMHGSVVVLGLGSGFLAITVVDLLLGDSRDGWWWPLIPGAILVTVGGSEIAGVRHVAQYLLPAVFIGIGIVLLFGRSHLRPKASDAERREASAGED